MLALAGYQNRDKLMDMFNSATGSLSKGGSGGGTQGDLSGMLGGLFGAGGAAGEREAWAACSAAASTSCSEQFTKNGQGKQPTPGSVEALTRRSRLLSFSRRSGPDVLAALEQQTGLSREELLARLSRELPTAIDKYTPDGRLPPRSA